jgi:hypothetical protein
MLRAWSWQAENSPLLDLFPGRATGDGAGLPLLLRPVQILGCLPMLAAGIGFEHTGIDREALTLDKAQSHRRPDNALEDVTHTPLSRKRPSRLAEKVE